MYVLEKAIADGKKRQPVSSPVREHTLRSKTREYQVPDSDTSEQPTKLPSTPHLPPKSPRHSSRIRALPQHLRYNSTQGYGYIPSPSAWIFEENGIVFSPTAFKAAASDPDTLSFDM